MSRVAPTVRGFTVGFPRVSGDEPAWSWATMSITPFSPRERG